MRRLRIKNMIAKLFLNAALKLDNNVMFDAFDKPSINILVNLESGTSFKQRYGYKSGEDAKCLGGVKHILGFNPLEGLAYMMEEGHVKPGAKETNLSIQGDSVFVDGKKVWTKDKNAEKDN